jgi:hypothetical protein
MNDMYNRIKVGTMEQLCIVGKTKEGEIVIGWSGVNPCDMQTLVGHLQCDIIFDCMKRAGI